MTAAETGSAQARSSTSLSVNLRLGQRLRQLRDGRGLTLHEVEDLVGGEIPASTLSAYERGIRSISALRLARLAGVYETTVEDIVEPVIHQADGEADIDG